MERSEVLTPSAEETGDPRGFVATAGLLILLYGAPALIYDRMASQLRVLWDGPDDPYLDRFRPVSAGVWEFFSSTSSLVGGACVLLIFLVVLYRFQRVRARRRARRLHQVVILIGFIGSLGSVLCVFHLLLLPLG